MMNKMVTVATFSEEIFSVLKNNVELVILIGCLVVAIVGYVLTSLYARDFNRSIGKIIIKVCEKVVSLILTVVLFALKIVEAVEVYIVLIIDVLSGRYQNRSLSRLMAFAITVLTIASYYTTVTGMENFISNRWIASIITIGIQAILLIIGVQLGKRSTIGSDADAVVVVPLYLKLLAAVAGAGALVYVVLKQFSIPTLFFRIFSILILAVIVMLILSLIYFVAANGVKAGIGAKIMFGIYIVTMCVSSFFSFHSFMDTLYDQETRITDNFIEAKDELLNMAETIDGKLPEKYFAEIKQQFVGNLDQILGAEVVMDETTAEESRLQADAYEHQQKEKELEALEEELRETVKRKNEAADLINAAEKRDAREMAVIQYEEHAGMEAELRERKAELEAAIKDYIENAEQMNGVTEKKARKEAYETSRAEMVTAAAELKQWLSNEGWTDTYETQAENNMQKINSYRAEYVADNINNLDEMLSLLVQYDKYKIARNTMIQKVMPLSLNKAGGLEDEYAEKMKEMKSYAEEMILMVPYMLPDIQGDIDGREYHIAAGAAVNYHTIITDYEKGIRNLDMSLNEIEQNIRAFSRNMTIGVLCAAMALLIDCLILFAGLMLPKKIEFFQDQEYTAEIREELLKTHIENPIIREES